jgi:hypothetical protein
VAKSWVLFSSLGHIEMNKSRFVCLKHCVLQFACHLESCARLFSTPKARRLHLIQAHAYPKEYFFAVTNKGIGGLLKRWGEGGSMIRGQWKPRDAGSEVQEQADEGDEHEEEDGDGDNSASHEKRNRDASGVDVVMEEDDEEARHEMLVSPDTSHSLATSGHDVNTDALDNLAHSMTSLSLVPPSIRFGRGGKNGGFVHRGTHTGAHSSVDSNTATSRSSAAGSKHAHPSTGGLGVREAGYASARGRGRGSESGTGRGRAAYGGHVNVNGSGEQRMQMSGAERTGEDTDVSPGPVQVQPAGANVASRGGAARGSSGRGVGRGGIAGVPGRRIFVPRGRGRGRGRGFMVIPDVPR